jgi:hypothetical protein
MKAVLLQDTPGGHVGLDRWEICFSHRVQRKHPARVGARAWGAAILQVVKGSGCSDGARLSTGLLADTTQNPYETDVHPSAAVFDLQGGQAGSGSAVAPGLDRKSKSQPWSAWLTWSLNSAP